MKPEYRPYVPSEAEFRQERARFAQKAIKDLMAENTRLLKQIEANKAEIEKWRDDLIDQWDRTK